MKVFVPLVAILLGLVLTGCPMETLETLAAQKTKQAYQICGRVGLSSAATTGLLEAAEADMLGGNSYEVEMILAAEGCVNSCLDVFCLTACHECATAVVEAVYSDVSHQR